MNQLNLFGNPKTTFQKSTTTELTIIENGEYCYYPDLFTKSESNLFFQELISKTEWKQESMFLYGKKINFPRLTAWYGDNDKPYTFSGITLSPLQWNETLLHIKERIEPIANVNFNSVLLNLYRNGNDSISWHSDAEKELGKNPIIASVNFGETRTFQLKHTKTKERIEIELTHGSLLIMKGELQHFWQHQVPKTTKQVKERVNLTFRIIK